MADGNGLSAVHNNSKVFTLLYVLAAALESLPGRNSSFVCVKLENSHSPVVRAPVSAAVATESGTAGIAHPQCRALPLVCCVFVPRQSAIRVYMITVTVLSKRLIESKEETSELLRLTVHN